MICLDGLTVAFTDWPRHLQESWQDCVQRGEVDAQHPPDTLVEAYPQVAEARAWLLGGFRYDEPGQDDDAEAEEEHQGSGVRRGEGIASPTFSCMYMFWVVGGSG